MEQTRPNILNFFLGKSESKETKQSQPLNLGPGEAPGVRFFSGVSNIPHDEKRYKGGEDAYTTIDSLIAVADGVGGWAEKGVDPGLFSKQLCRDI